MKSPADGLRRMALVVQSGAADRLEEAAAFAASGAAMGMAVEVLFTGPALRCLVEGRLEPSVAARFADAREVGTLRLYGCSAALRRAGVAPEEATAAGASFPLDGVLGIPAFLERLAGAEVQLFI